MYDVDLYLLTVSSGNVCQICTRSVDSAIDCGQNRLLLAQYIHSDEAKLLSSLSLPSRRVLRSPRVLSTLTRTKTFRCRPDPFSVDRMLDPRVFAVKWILCSLILFLFRLCGVPTVLDLGISTTI